MDELLMYWGYGMVTIIVLMLVGAVGWLIVSSVGWLAVPVILGIIIVPTLVGAVLDAFVGFW